MNVQMCKVPSFYLALQPQVDWTASSRRTGLEPGWDHRQRGVGGGPSMAAIFGPEEPIILPWTVLISQVIGHKPYTTGHNKLPHLM